LWNSYGFGNAGTYLYLNVGWGITFDLVAPSSLNYQVTGSIVRLEWLVPTFYNPFFISYGVYRDGVQIANADITTPSFTDPSILMGSHSYEVSAIYTTGESTLSNTVNVDIEIGTVSGIVDDGVLPLAGVRVGGRCWCFICGV